MPHSFHMQPYEGAQDLQNFFERVVGDDRLTTLDISVAWVRRTGLELIADSLYEFRRRGGRVRVTTGISQGGTSLQGLKMLVECVDAAYVFHVPDRTFHPKVYASRGRSNALTQIGSNNLTGGGAATNFEAAIVSELDLELREDATFYAAIEESFERLIGDEGVCRPLDAEFIQMLAENDRYVISDEDATRASDEAFLTGDDAGGGLPRKERLFTASKFRLRKREARRRPGRNETTRSRRPMPAATVHDAAEVAPRPDEVIVRRWFKVLPKSDAQQLGGRSSPTNTMTLVRYAHPIDAASYFRDELFGAVQWHVAATRGRLEQPREVASVEFTVFIEGAEFGRLFLEIRHTPGYDADQGNRITELAWGELGAYLRTNDHAGDYATIELTSSGRFLLSISEEPIGEFV